MVNVLVHTMVTMVPYGLLMSIGIRQHLFPHQLIVLFDYGMFKQVEKDIPINRTHHVDVVHSVMMEMLFSIPMMMLWVNRVK